MNLQRATNGIWSFDVDFIVSGFQAYLGMFPLVVTVLNRD